MAPNAAEYAVNAMRGRLLVTGVAALMLVASTAGLRQGLAEIHANWSTINSHFAHGYLVLAMAAVLGLRAYRGIGHIHVQPEWRMIPALFVLLGLLFVSVRLDITSSTQSLVPIILFCAFAAVLGLEAMRPYVWATACVYFALPVWYIFNAPLQFVTAEVNEALVRIAGIPAHVDGNSFELPSGVIEVASGCSGLNYLISALAIAYYQGMMYLKAWPARLKLLAVAAIAAIVINWLRVFLLIVIAYASDMQHYFIRVDHFYFGWILFAAVLVPICWIGFRLEQQERADPVKASGAGAVNMTVEPRSVLAFGAVVSLLLLVPMLFSA